ncbi:MAG TPA: ankyrin repeat domain-containing protein [Vicinamibacterales bacterium]|nr:ankyrin repeat domain-containing protein [Vicinamibacterales bacterium]
MMRGHTIVGGSIAALSLSALLGATAPASSIADAAMRHDAAAVHALIAEHGDVNASQGDGMTALHWAASQADAELVTALLHAGADVNKTTRLGGYEPLHLAAQVGAAPVIDLLVAAGARVGAPTSTGATPLMLAATSGRADAVKTLLDHGADPNATESSSKETALMFAAAADRADVATLLLQRGARPELITTVTDFSDATAPEVRLQEELRQKETARAAAAAAAKGEKAPAPPPPAFGARGTGVAGLTRGYTYEELVGKQGGLTALHLAARQGASRTVQALVAGGANVNQVSADGTTPLVISTINGQLDIAKYLLEHGASPTLGTDAGMTPLFAALNIEWAPKSFYPQPRAQLEQHTGYLDLMRELLDKGADPNTRLKRKIWYTQYNFDLLRVDETGATPFWRAAYASDIAAMKLLLEYGADPNIPTTKPAGRVRGVEVDREADLKDVSKQPPVPVGGPGIPPLLAAAGAGYGEGFAANAHRFAPTGMLAAVKFLIEEVGADVNAQDSDGNTAIHNAASRGDNEMIEYLVSKGGDPKAVNRGGRTTVDMANGPVQRTQPYPDTIKLLESLGAKNNHKCVSC